MQKMLPLCPTANFRMRFSPEQTNARAVPLSGALAWITANRQQGAQLEALEIAGPGDPLATPELIMEAAAYICREHPDIQLRMSTLGLHCATYAEAISVSGISEVTLLVDAVDPEVAKKIYAWVRPAKKTLPKQEAIEVLLKEQRLAVSTLKNKNLDVTIRTTVYPGYNDENVEQIAISMAALGADGMELVPFCPAGCLEEDAPPQADEQLMNALYDRCLHHFEHVVVKQKEAPGPGMDCTSSAGNCNRHSEMLPRPSKERPNLAVVSSNGMEIDLHLGQAYQLLIYGPREDGLTCLLETRPAPEPGSGSSRWEELAQSIPDCFAILAASAGETPRKVLAQHGITVLITDGEIEGTADVLFGGGKKGKKKC